MSTVCDLKIKAKEMGLKGYSKMKKAELEKLVMGASPVEAKPASPAKKAPAKKAPAKEEKLSAREIRDQQKVPYSVVLKRKDSDGIPYINIWDSYLMRAIKLEKDEKYPKYEDDEAKRIIGRTRRELKGKFRRGLPLGVELTAKEWRKEMMDFMNKEDKSIKAVLKRKGLE